MIEKMNSHYSFTNPASVYDEEALTALELVGRIGAKLNEAIEAYNTLENNTDEKLTAYNEFINTMNAVTMPAEVKKEVDAHIARGDFDKAINTYIGNLESRVNTIIANTTQGSTTLDTEVIDGRVAHDGGVYNFMGDHIRSIGKILSRIYKHDPKTSIVDLNAIMFGYINGAVDGGVKDDPSGQLYCTDYCEVEQGVSYYAKSLYHGYYAWYDENKVYISGAGVKSDSTILPQPFTPPANARYVRFTLTGRGVQTIVTPDVNYLPYKFLMSNEFALNPETFASQMDYYREISAYYMPCEVGASFNVPTENSVLIHLSRGSFDIIDSVRSLTGKAMRITPDENLNAHAVLTNNKLKPDQYINIRYKSDKCAPTIVRNRDGKYLDQITRVVNTNGEYIVDSIKVEFNDYNPETDTIQFVMVANSECVIDYLSITNTYHFNLGVDKATHNLLTTVDEIEDIDGHEVTIFNKGCCIGDSITQGTFNHRVNGSTGNYITNPLYAYPAYFKKITGVDVDNMGNGGMSAPEWYAAHADTDLSGYDFAIIWLGINDALKSVSSSDFTTSMTDIINKLKTENKGVKIFVATITPAYCDGVTTYDYINDAIRALVSISDVYLVDMANLSICHKGSAYENGHLSALGYAQSAKEFSVIISKIIRENLNDFRNIQFVSTDYSY